MPMKPHFHQAVMNADVAAAAAAAAADLFAVAKAENVSAAKPKDQG